jgi:uncharacterized protein YecT (DUF1311 family)
MRSLVGFAVISVVVLGGSPSLAQHMNAPASACRNAVTTADMSRCFDQAFKAADRELNGVYAEVRAVLAEKDRQNLQDAQRAWLKYRDATCAAEYALYGGGTGGTPARLACLEAQTRQRTSDLRTTYGWKVEKTR